MVESKTSPDTNPIWFRDFFEAQSQITIFLGVFLDSLKTLNHRGRLGPLVKGHLTVGW